MPACSGWSCSPGLGVRVSDSDPVRYRFLSQPLKEECREQKGGALENIPCGGGLSAPFCLSGSQNTPSPQDGSARREA